VRRFLICLAVCAAAGCTGPQLLNAFTPSGGYRHAQGVAYDAGRRLSLDVYTPVGARREPVVVFFHGGRWTTGAAADFHFVGQALASQGFVAVLPEYRRYPQARFPDFVEDAARAVRWTETQIARFGGDPDKLFVMGHSSGAHLAAMLALDAGFLAAAGGDRARLKGMIGLAGPYDFLPLTDADLRDMFGPPERHELSQPIAFADGDNPPLLLLHGEDDETVRVRNTRNLATAVQRAGGRVDSHVYAEMSHAWIVATLAAPLRGRSDVLERVAGFVRRHAAGKAEGGIVSVTPGEGERAP
jgi:acetyl esterase/lipase